ncbi:MAG: MFS transporter [Desulfobacteraceae bacterium 4484_190.1]|nr:MAG: MFS transporter [Desulfobacteraceae bacterium 4484_190.1]
MSSNIKIFITLFLSVFVTTMGAGIIAPLLPVYTHELGGTAFEISLIFGAFSLTRSIFVPYFGKLSDQKGMKPFLTSGLFIYFIMSISYAYARDVNTLIFIRLGQGFASAMIFPVAQAYVGMITPLRQEGRIMGIFNMSLYGGLCAGPLIGGIIKDWFSLEYSFFSMGALTLSGFLLCLVFLPPEKQTQQEHKQVTKKTVPYLTLLKNPMIFSLFMFRACFTTCIGITWAFLPLLADMKYGFSSSAIGILVSINVFVSAIFQLPMGYLSDRFNKKIFVTAGGIIGTIAIYYINQASSFVEFAIANAVLGLAGGISFPAIMALGVIEGRRNKAMGSLMGLLSLGHSIGMLTGPLLAGALIDIFSFGIVFNSGAVILCVGTLLFIGNKNAWKIYQAL